MEIKERIPRLLDAICAAYNKALPGGPWSPVISSAQVITTYCNFACNSIALRMEYAGFEDDGVPLLANEICKKMSDPNGDWIKLGNGDVAQAKANEGGLVIAGRANPAGHGHICVVMPGLMEYSGSWSKMVPKCMNVGKDVFIGKKVSWAFRANEEPDYFGLKSMV